MMSGGTGPGDGGDDDESWREALETPAARGLRLVDEHDAAENAWRARLLTHVVGSKDAPKEVVLPCSANAMTVLRYHRDWRDTIAYDAFSESVVMTRSPPWDPSDSPGEAAFGEWSDSDTVRAMHWLARRESLHVRQQVVDQVVPVVAESNVVHPVRAYLRSLRWDAKVRLPTVLPDLFGTQDSPYARAVGTRWFVSAVARVMSPGCQADCTLILEGATGIGKTSAFRALVPVRSWYADTGITIGDKDSYQSLRGVWIYGLDELDSIKRSERTRTKNFLSQTQDRYRPSYGRRARTFLRQNVFCGTTNEETYLGDPSGDRRYWPVRVVRQTDRDAVAAARDHLWAEAVARYDSGEVWHVDTPELRALCETEQAARQIADPWAPVVASWLSDPRTDELTSSGSEGPTARERYDDSAGVLTVDVLRYALRIRVGDHTKGHEMRAAEVLRSLGYERGPLVREGNARVRRYLKT